ncbi:MAG TPA: hypothetical protein VHM26_13915 [Chitinophagaceae bacterium]|jgi:c-di-AMP phosphodiesterase-like protein|nr:hypothetical protein [Chitinophagaceae bacterium]
MKDLKIYKEKRVHAKYAIITLIVALVLLYVFFFGNDPFHSHLAVLAFAGVFMFISAMFFYHYMDRKPVYIISDKIIIHRNGRINWDDVGAFKSDEHYDNIWHRSVTLFDKQGKELLVIILTYTDASLRKVESRMRRKKLKRIGEEPLSVRYKV